MKNLFVKDKKDGDLWLITTRHDLVFKLTKLAKFLKVKDFRMAPEDKMIELLGVAQGCATPLALFNDKDRKGQKAKFLIRFFNPHAVGL